MICVNFDIWLRCNTFCTHDLSCTHLYLGSQLPSRIWHSSLGSTNHHVRGLSLDYFILFHTNNSVDNLSALSKMLQSNTVCFIPLFKLIVIIYPLTVRVVGAPEMISQPVSSIFPCSQLPPGTWRTPGLVIP